MSLSYWNGQIVPAGEVRISPGDAGFLFGDGLFETLRVDHGQARDVEAHLDRLFAGLRRVQIDPPEKSAALAGAVAEVAAAAPHPVARLRITITQGTDGCPTRLITTAPYDPPEERSYREGVAAHLLPDHRIDSSSPLAGLKSLCYQLNRLALHIAESHGAFEALLMNERGRLAEGARSNVAVVFPDGVFTPPKSDGCLPGTVRRRLLEKKAIKEWPIAPEDLATASEVLLMNSLIGVLPVSRVSGREVPVGPTAARLRAMLEEERT